MADEVRKIAKGRVSGNIRIETPTVAEALAFLEAGVRLGVQEIEMTDDIIRGYLMQQGASHDDMLKLFLDTARRDYATLEDLSSPYGIRDLGSDQIFGVEALEWEDGKLTIDVNENLVVGTYSDQDDE
jgi:hypothetical protein